MSRVVVKIGTSSLTNEAGEIDRGVVERVVRESVALRDAGHTLTVVTSGAIAAGMPVLGISASDRPADAVTLQALSSIGQPALVQTWSEAFDSHGLSMGQILLAPHNFGQRRQYLHARSTLAKLHELGVVPLINENDAVTDTEIRYGDNDRIAALVAQMVEADTLILLTDTDGVLTADPRLDPDASLIEQIVEFDQNIDQLAGAAGSVRGSGGMASKLTAAKIASWSGVRTVIANAQRKNVLADAVNGVDGVGTTVMPRETTLTARKLWIGFALDAAGTVTVDAGAEKALAEGGRSLLAVGVTKIDGNFEYGDAIDVVSADGKPVAKGLTRMTSADLEAQRSTPPSDRREQRSLVVHADDLVLLLS